MEPGTIELVLGWFFSMTGCHTHTNKQGCMGGCTHYCTPSPQLHHGSIW